MTDAVLSQIEQILQGIETRTEHDIFRQCAAVRPGYGGIACTCDRAARVRAEIARTVERMIRDAMWATFNETWSEIYDKDPGKLPTPAEEREIYKSGWAASIRAAGGTQQ